MEPDETRAETARRRLAQLVATFDARLPPEAEPGAEPPEPASTDAAGQVPAAAEPPRRGLPHRGPRRTGPTHVRVVAALVGVAAVLIGWQVVSGRPSLDPAGGSPALTVDTGASGDGADDGSGEGDAADEELLVVDVVGHVHQPGIVTLPPGSRVHEAIDAAGGLTGPVDLTTLNLARRLTDGEQILVGIEPAVPPAASAPGAGGSAGALVNINTATESELQDLPGVGPVTASSIVAWRSDHGRFTAVEDLLEVRGIGEATLANLRDHVTV